jgi:hypothetical protein
MHLLPTHRDQFTFEIHVILAALVVCGSAGARRRHQPRPAESHKLDADPRAHTPTPTTGAITAADLKTRLYIFADDSMQGRMLATAGNAKGVEYIASELKRMGLEPMGENGTYFQTVNLVDRKYDPASQLIVGGATFAPWIDFALRDQGSAARSLNGVQAVFGGTWGDSASLIDPAAASGKLVVLKVNASGVTQNSGGGVNRALVTRRFANSAGIAIASLEALPPLMIQIFQQTNQLIRNGEDPVVPSFMYVNKRVATALLNANVDSIRTGAVGATVTSAEVREFRPSIRRET